MRGRTRLAQCLATAIAAALVVPASAVGQPESVVAETTRGGSCSLEALIARAGGTITYGGRVPQCSAKFGVRGVSGRTMLYEGINTALQADVSAREHGDAPFEIIRSFEGVEDEPYEARFDATVQIRGAKKGNRKRREYWEDPGRGCRVGTTTRAADTLFCVLSRVAPP